VFIKVLHGNLFLGATYKNASDLRSSAKSDRDL
jgi:hypothetical protein